MGIYIKGMEMPKNCYECDDMFLLSTIRCECCEFGLNERPTDCPLTEVSEPHGRLIDADALKEQINTTFWSEIGEIIDNAPTVSADRPHGEWIKRGTKITCSHCKSAWSASFDTIIVGMKYCPNCGAKMGGDGEC